METKQFGLYCSVPPLVLKRFKVQELLGAGSFGEIYKAECIKTKLEVAIKFEKARNKYPQLFHEGKVLRAAAGEGIPRILAMDSLTTHQALVIELLGPSLEDLFNYCGRKFSFKTVAMLIDQMISRLEHLHSVGYIHRDLKPENFLMGVKQNKKDVYLIDFGLAKLVYDPVTLQHITVRTDKSMVGTARYTSIHTHIGIEQSRRDDIEALSYILVYFAKGSLPWQGLKAIHKQDKYTLIGESKISTSIEVLCENLPSEFKVFVKYAQTLAFTQQPDYRFLRSLLQHYLFANKLQYDYRYDWTINRRSNHSSPTNQNVNTKTTTYVDHIKVNNDFPVQKCGYGCFLKNGLSDANKLYEIYPEIQALSKKATLVMLNPAQVACKWIDLSTDEFTTTRLEPISLESSWFNKSITIDYEEDNSANDAALKSRAEVCSDFIIESDMSLEYFAPENKVRDQKTMGRNTKNAIANAFKNAKLCKDMGKSQPAQSDVCKPQHCA